MSPDRTRPLNAFGVKEIPSAELRLADVPPPDSAWLVVVHFAVTTFDGYEVSGSFQKCAETANSVLRHWQKTRALPDSLDDLRVALFFEQRAWHYSDQDPDAAAMVFVRAILTALRQMLTTTDTPEEGEEEVGP